MQLVLNNGIFFEFVPFDQSNFTTDGTLVENPEVLTLRDVQEGKEYAVLISTCAGAWRYLIGDTVKITNKERAEIIITGRTKHFLSLCGEHLSVDNMTKALHIVSEDMICIRSFVQGWLPRPFRPQMYLGIDEAWFSR
jgi:hypothetical protein